MLEAFPPISTQMKVLFFLLCVVATALSYSLVNQKRVLEKIFDSTNGNGWRRKDHWKVGNPCEKDKIWYGLKCSGHIVINISLEKNGLGGLLPAEIGELEYLQHLNLHGNSLIGNIPTTIGKLTDLNYLSLQANNFRGNLPNEIGNLTKLRLFYIGNNNLDGQIPKSIGRLRSLQYLEMTHNSFSGPVPNELTQIPLMLVNGAFNQFEGTFPAGLCRVLTCGFYGNLKLKCPSQNCKKCNLQSCNCGNVCLNANDCAGGLCKSCVARGMIKYCQ